MMSKNVGKKVFGFVMLTLVSLSFLGCGKVEKVNISFEDAYRVFISSHQSAIDSKALLSTLEGKWKTHSVFGVNTVDSTTGFNLRFDTSGVADQDALLNSGTTNVALSTHFQDQEYSLSTDFSMIQSVGTSGFASLQQFFKIDNFEIDLGTGNIQAVFAKSMIDSLSGSWIKMDLFEKLVAGQETSSLSMQSFDDGKKIMTNLFTLGTTMKDIVVLENLGMTEYQGYTAYDVNVRPEAIKMLIQHVFTGTTFAQEQMDLSEIEQLHISGLLIVKSADEVELLLNTFGESKAMTTVLFAKAGIAITHILEDGTNITVDITKKDMHKIGLTFAVSLPASSGYTPEPQTVTDTTGNTVKDTKHISGKKDAVAHINGNFLIIGDFSDTVLESELHGNIVVLSEALLQSLGMDKLDIVVDLTTKSEKVDDVNISLPTSSLLFSQLLSDKFGMSYMQNMGTAE